MRLLRDRIDVVIGKCLRHSAVRPWPVARAAASESRPPPPYGARSSVIAEYAQRRGDLFGAQRRRMLAVDHFVCSSGYERE